MQFLITAHDGKGMLERRMEVRPRHLENMDRVKDHVLCAGGLLDENGTLAGSTLIMEFDSREQLEDYLKHEPYVSEGVWAKIDIEPMNVVILDRKRYL